MTTSLITALATLPNPFLLDLLPQTQYLSTAHIAFFVHYHVFKILLFLSIQQYVPLPIPGYGTNVFFFFGDKESCDGRVPKYPFSLYSLLCNFCLVCVPMCRVINSEIKFLKFWIQDFPSITTSFSLLFPLPSNSGLQNTLT